MGHGVQASRVNVTALPENKVTASLRCYKCLLVHFLALDNTVSKNVMLLTSW